MPSLDYFHVDVFSDRPFSGNSLPVFMDGGDLDADEMLKITQELRHFETIFLQPTARADTMRARVFDLFEELPFAGHPLLGAAAVLHHRSGQPGEVTWRFILPAKEVTVATERTATGFSGLLDQGAPEFLGEIDVRSMIARAFALTASDLDPDLPLEVVSTGLRYLIVPVRPGALQRARIATDITDLLREQGAQFAVLFDKAAVEIRHWNNDGVIEDVATGSAAGTIGAFCVMHGLAAARTPFTLHQGRFTGRPSRLRLLVEVEREAITTVKIGGEVAIVGRGTLDQRPGASV